MSEEAFYLAPTFWVALSFVVFVALAIRPVSRFAARSLDARSAQIAAELTQAHRLRQEAETLLATYQKKQNEALKEAELILVETRNDAKRLAEQAELELKAALDKRIKLATDKITQAESKAIQEVQAHVVDIAIAAARTLIHEYLLRTGNEELIRQATTELERKLH